MERHISSLSSWVLAIRKALDADGHDGLAVCREAGLDLALLDNSSARYPLDQTTRLWRLAIARTNDPAFGLRVASAVGPLTFQALSYTLMASATLKEALECCVRYFHIATDAADLQLEAHGDEYHLVVRNRPSEQASAVEATDAFVSLLLRTCRALYGREFSPLRIDLSRAAPADIRPFAAILRASLRFNAEQNRLVLDAAQCEQHLAGANPELARHNEEIARRHLARLVPRTLAQRIEIVLAARLAKGEPTHTAVAKELGVSVRTMQRRLSEEHTNYTAVLDQLRHQQAIQLLAEGTYGVTEVTYLLGFADTSSFNRAFRRWTGCAPGSFRG